MAAFTSTLLYSCASSDNSTDTVTGTAMEAEVTESETAPQAPMDPDTDMTAEDNRSTTVSADNTLGRNMSIVALVQQTPNLSTLFELIRAANMMTTLESPAPYTVFAPTNEAFAALPAGTVEALKQPENQMELRRLLQAHILPNRVKASEIQHNMPMKTAQGDEIIAKRNGQAISVGGATVLTSDVEASNGVVHVIDKVLVPPQE